MKQALTVVVCVWCAPLCVHVALTNQNTLSAALQSTAADAATVLSNARTVVVIGVTGKTITNRPVFTPDGERAKAKVETVLREWGKYKLVDDMEHADLVLVVLETQKNINLFRLANLVAELKVYQGGQAPTPETPMLWSGDAAEGFKKLPATKVAEKFKEYVMKLPHARPGT